MKIINFTLTDHKLDKYVLVNTTKQQFFALPKEESQVFTSREYDYAYPAPEGFPSDPETQSEHRDWMLKSITDPHMNTSFTPTDYMGMSIMTIPYKLLEEFADFRLFNPADDSHKDFYTEEGNNVKTFTVGVQMIKIPSNIFNTVLTDEDEIAENGGSNIIPKYGNYLLNISPKYIESTITSIERRGHFPFHKIGDNYVNDDGDIYPEKLRRNTYYINYDDLLGTIWNLEANTEASGRLIGSVVEVWNSNGTILKQTKVMAECEFLLFSEGFRFVLSPDNVGYDSEENVIGLNDVVRIYPRETHFDHMVINIDYQDPSASIKAALQYMVNDVTRDLTTGIYEIYDESGVKIDSSGNFNGKVIQKYQVQQFGKFEVRKKLKD